MILWIACGLLTLMFLFAGVTKLTGMEMHVVSFDNWGLPQWFRSIVGVLEVVGAVLVIIPTTREKGAIILIALMLGATLVHLKAGETSALAAPLIAIALAGFVLASTYGLL